LTDKVRKWSKIAQDKKAREAFKLIKELIKKYTKPGEPPTDKKEDEKPC